MIDHIKDKSAMDEIKRLRERLEIDPRHPYDGIADRDETIRKKDKVIDELRAENKRLCIGCGAQTDAAGQLPCDH